MSNDLVSIITPLYNASQFILDTIASVVAQSYSNWEMLIVDDCSTDGSYELVQNYISDHNENRIKLLKTVHNSGAAEARNYALREASGRWIAFLDSDDMWYPEKLEKQINFMKKNGYHFSYTWYEEVDETSKPLNRIITGPSKVSSWMMKKYCWIGCLTVMYDVEPIGLVQINPEIGNGRNDYALWLKVAQNVDCCYLLKENLAMYRRRAQSLSRRSYSVLIKYNYEMFKLTYDCSALRSLWLTANNLLFGTIKKLVYKTSFVPDVDG